MRVFFTEKPDVGRELAGYLGRKNKTTPKKSENGRSINVGNDVVVWGRGHLLGLAEPDHYFRNRGFQKNAKGKYSWRDVPLPILPETFETLPPADDPDRKKQLDEIGRLMKKADEVWNAGDADREGQLIFDEIKDYFEIKKPIKRIMFSALDDAAFDRAFAAAGNNADPKIANMGVAAKMRSQADWLIGMNATRALSLAHGNSKTGVLNIGRVLTPTIAIVVRRQKEMNDFKPSAIYTPTVKMPDGTVLTWNKRIGSDDIPGIKDGKIIDKALAQKIVDAINNGLTGEITESKSVEKSEAPPLPFSLPSIQSELSKKHGLTVDEITKACQSLYEKKMQSYVGTDCRYLPESMHSESIAVLKGLNTKYNAFVGKADSSIKYACWDDSKVSGDGGAAHHAIIPTGQTGPIGSEAERIVYDAVCRRYLSQFHPEHKYLSMSVVSLFGNDEFKTTAIMTLSQGWRDVEGTPEEERATDSERNDMSDKVSGKPANKR